MRYASGEVYKGDWHVGQRSGRGEMIYGTDKTNRYIGSWMNSKKHGPGTFYFGNGDIFVGEWSRGNMHGRGQYIFACGDSFIGFYSNGKKDHGDYYFTQNDTDYRGNWRDEHFDGRGSTRYSNNETYLGNWMQGKRHGRDSCYVWPSGSRFNGTFEHGQLRKGLYRSANNMGEYEGSFVHGRRCGIGLARFDDGSVYRGQFQHDRMHGSGSYKFPCGSLYIGNYVKNKRDNPRRLREYPIQRCRFSGHGWGLLKDQTGEVIYQGIFVDGQPRDECVGNTS